MPGHAHLLSQPDAGDSLFASPPRRGRGARLRQRPGAACGVLRRPAHRRRRGPGDQEHQDLRIRDRRGGRSRRRRHHQPDGQGRLRLQRQRVLGLEPRRRRGLGAGARILLPRGARLRLERHQHLVGDPALGRLPDRHRSIADHRQDQPRAPALRRHRLERGERGRHPGRLRRHAARRRRRLDRDLRLHRDRRFRVQLQLADRGQRRLRGLPLEHEPARFDLGDRARAGGPEGPFQRRGTPRPDDLRVLLLRSRRAPRACGAGARCRTLTSPRSWRRRRPSTSPRWPRSSAGRSRRSRSYRRWPRSSP